MKKRVAALFCVIVFALCAVLLFGCGRDRKYFDKVSAYSFWDNEGNQSIAQYKFYDIMDSFFAEGEIADGSCVKDGKVRKILFVGWDGTRADALSNVLFDENSFDTNGYNYPVTGYSGLNLLAESGGVYLAYAGGEKGKDSEQETSTCAGWTSELTGAWHTVHGVDTNDDVKNASAETIMLKYAKLGLNTGLAFEWGQYFDVTLRHEVSYLLENPSLPMLLCDIDRTVAASDEDIMRNENIEKKKDIKSASLEHYNAVAMKGNIHAQETYDVAMRDYIIGRIEAGDDFVGGIFHSPDSNGHTYGFGNESPNYVNSVRNADNYLYTILQVVAEREAECNEEWLVVVTADHGGSKTGHGKQYFEHRTIWIACNRPVDPSYFASDYDGYRE